MDDFSPSTRRRASCMIYKKLPSRKGTRAKTLRGTTQFHLRHIAEGLARITDAIPAAPTLLRISARQLRSEFPARRVGGFQPMTAFSFLSAFAGCCLHLRFSIGRLYHGASAFASTFLCHRKFVRSMKSEARALLSHGGLPKDSALRLLGELLGIELSLIHI